MVETMLVAVNNFSLKKYFENIMRVSNNGFTLMEILIAISILTLFLGITIQTTESTHDKLLKLSYDIERTFRFTDSEATLRNVIMRVHFSLEEKPQSFTVEYGPNDNFVLPPVNTKSKKDMSLEEQEEFEKAKKQLNLQFNTVEEFADQNTELEENLMLIGVGSILYNELIVSGDPSIYVQPSGERDASVIYISSDEEIIEIEIDPFSGKITRNFYPLEFSDGDNYEEKVIDEAFKLYTKWREKK